jgi:ribosomal protein L37AE/L43A
MIGMDKRDERRPDRRQQQGRRGHEFVTLKDAAQRSKRERERREQAKQQKAGDKTRCEHCGGPLRACGAVGRAGHLRWKCRKCGRTVWVRPEFKPPVPIVPMSKAAARGG